MLPIWLLQRNVARESENRQASRPARPRSSRAGGRPRASRHHPGYPTLHWEQSTSTRLVTHELSIHALPSPGMERPCAAGDRV